jgi:ribosomal protein L37E
LATTVTEEWIYEYWDCPKCGQKGIRGDEYKCPSCGYPRDKNIIFYRKTEEEKVESLEEIKSFQKGPDWVCAFCQSLNHQEDLSCKGCGATKESSEKNYFEEKERQEEKFNKPKLVEQSKVISKKFILSILGIFSLFLGYICWGVSTHKEIYQVKEKKWVRAVEVQTYIWQNRSNWKDEIQGDDPQILSQNREIRSYEKRQVGTKQETYTDTESYQSGTKKECSTSYTSTGSGASKKVTTCSDVPTYSTRYVTKTRTVPVYQDFPIYDTKVVYRAKSYITKGYVILEGRENSPSWPKFPDSLGVDNKPDREGEKLESYQVRLEKIQGEKGPQSETIEVNFESFEKTYLLNEKVEISVNNFGILNLNYEEKVFNPKEYEEKFNKVFSSRLNK